MSVQLLRLKLQFFAGKTTKEEDEVTVIDENTNPTSAVITTPIVPAPAPMAPTREQYGIDVGEMDEESYYAKYDLDPERDYQNTVNTLNYEYQTSMATYGENAEKMYQMGLQNSGVSDIFQANAFSSYLGNMNQAAADRITARKRNKAAFNDYVAGINKEFAAYEQNWKNDRTNTENTAFTTAAQAFNGYNLEEVRQLLTASNYDQGIIDNVMNRIGTLDLNSLKNATSRELAGKILEVIPNFTGSDADIASVEALFGGAVPAEALSSAITMAKTLYENSPEAADATVNSWINTLYGSFTGNEVDFDDWKNSQLKDVPEELQNKIIEGIRHEFDGRVGEIYSDLVERYTPENETSLKEHYKNLGYNDYEISEAMRMIKNVYNSDPGAQAATTEKNVAAIISTFGENAADFDPSNYGNDKQTFINEMIKDGTYNEEEAGQAWEQMKANWDAKAPERVQAIVDTFGFGTDKFDPTSFNRDEEAFVKQVMKNGVDEADAREAYKQIEGYMKTLDAAVSDIYANTLKGVYTGSEAEKQLLEESMNAEGITNQNERQYILDQLDLKRESAGGNTVDFVNKTLGEIKDKNGIVTAGDRADAYNQILVDEALHGETAETIAMKKELKTDVMTDAKSFISGTGELSAAPEKLGTYLSNETKDNWGNMSNDEKRRAIIQDAFNNKTIQLNANEKAELVKDYISSKTKKIIDTDKTNRKASGLADAGELVTYVEGLEFDSNTTKNLIKDIIYEMGFEINGGQIKWSGKVKGAEASIYWGMGTPGEEIKITDSDYDRWDYEKAENIYDTTGNRLISLNGNLYYKESTYGTWRKIKAGDFNVVGDGHTNTDTQKKGIYNLLIVLLEMKQDSGYVEGKLPSDTTVTPGGTVNLKQDHNYYQSKETDGDKKFNEVQDYR